jgi:peptidoglycan/LPS O-acetylase OafA/YrhL
MIPGLDGVRGFAFALVFFLHADYFYGGWVGVQLFFVLSGFLITDILLRMKEKFSAGDFFRKFYGRRFLRIFPLYYFYLLLMFVVTAIVLQIGYRIGYMERFRDHLPYAIFYVYDLFNASSAFKGESWLIGHLWSLSLEEQFYIVWPLLVFLTPQKHIKKLFYAAIITGPLFRLAVSALYYYGDPTFLYEDMGITIYVLPFSQLDAFGLGALITRIDDIPKARWQFFAMLVAIPFIGFTSAYLSTGELGNLTALGFGHPLEGDLKQVWGYFYFNYLFALLIYLVVREKRFLKFFDNKFLSYVGKISYGLYIYHFATIWFVARMRDLSIPEAYAKPLTLIVSAVLVYSIASLSYKYFEKPILDLKDRYFPLTSRAQPPVSDLQPPPHA